MVAGATGSSMAGEGGIFQEMYGNTTIDIVKDGIVHSVAFFGAGGSIVALVKGSCRERSVVQWPIGVILSLWRADLVASPGGSTSSAGWFSSPTGWIG